MSAKYRYLSHTLPTLSALFVAVFSTTAEAERYNLIPELNFIHSNGVCQVFTEKPAKNKEGNLLMRVFTTCNTQPVGYQDDARIRSYIQWTEIRCSTREYKTTQIMYFERQFWDLQTRTSTFKDVVTYSPFPEIGQDVSYGGAFQRACDPAINNRSTL